METLKQLSKKIRISCEYGAPENESFKNSDGWTVKLQYGRKQLTTPFYMGYGHGGKEPTSETVLDSLLLDASSFNCARDFEDFCSELGYNSDSRKAEKIYKDCGRISKKLRNFLGEDFDKFNESER